MLDETRLRLQINVRLSPERLRRLRAILDHTREQPSAFMQRVIDEVYNALPETARSDDHRTA